MEKQGEQKKTQTRTVQVADGGPASPSKRRRNGLERDSESRAFNAAHTGIVIFSPSGKAYSFDDVLAEGGMNMLCDPWISDTDAIRDFGVRDDDPVLDELHRAYTGIVEQLEAEKKQGELKQKLPGKKVHPLYGKPINDMSLEELRKLKADLLDLKGKAMELLAKKSSASSSGTGN